MQNNNKNKSEKKNDIQIDIYIYIKDKLVAHVWLEILLHYENI